MFNVGNLSDKLAEKIAKEIDCDNEKRDVIAYGIFGMLQIFISILLVIIFGALFNVMIEVLIISLSIGILRKYSGGIHASTPNSCMVIGTAICIIGALVVSRVQITFDLTLIFGIVIFIISYYLIHKLAPVYSVNKPIKNIKRRKELKRKIIMRKINGKLVMGIATIATMFAGAIATSACLWSFYQPKEPKSLREE